MMYLPDKRHAGFYAGLLSDLNKKYLDGHAAKSLVLERLEREWGQIEKAFLWTATIQNQMEEERALICNAILESGASLLDLFQPSAERIEWLKMGISVARRYDFTSGEALHLARLGWAYHQTGNNREGESCCVSSLTIAQQINDQHIQMRALGYLGSIKRAQGEYSQAFEYHKAALQLSRALESKRWEGVHLANLGNDLRSLGRYDEAIKKYEAALEIHRVLDDQRSIGLRLGNIGLTLNNINRSDDAIQYLKQALEIAQRIGDDRSKLFNSGNLADAYYALGQYTDAWSNYEMALELAIKLNDRRLEGFWTGRIGTFVFYQEGDQEKAIRQITKALKVADEIGDKRYKGNWLSELGKIYFRLGDYPQAEILMKQSLEIALETGHERQIERRKAFLSKVVSKMHEAEEDSEFT